MAIAFPYSFDTTQVRRQITTFAVLLEAVLVLGIAYRLVVSPDVTAVVVLTVSGAMVAGLALVIHRHIGGARGTITRDGVVVEQPQPGRYPLGAFKALRVEHMSGPSDPMLRGGPHVRVSLIGLGGAPDLLVLRVSEDDDAEGRELAGALGLPLEDVRVPH